MPFKTDWRLEYHKAYKRNMYYSIALAILFHFLLFFFVRSWNVKIATSQKRDRPKFYKVKYVRPKFNIPKEVKPVKDKKTFSPKEKPIAKPEIDPKEEVVEVPIIEEEEDLDSNQGGEVRSPYLSYKKVPEYPDNAKTMGIEGKVYLWVYLDEEGNVEGVKIQKSSGSDVLDRCAKRAAKGCKFTPAIQNDVPVKSSVLLPYQFILISGSVQ